MRSTRGRRWTSSQASASPISRGFPKTNAEAVSEIDGADCPRSVRPEWTLLPVSYLISGAVVWAMRAVFAEAG
jgi:hypothetical protein